MAVVVVVAAALLVWRVHESLVARLDATATRQALALATSIDTGRARATLTNLVPGTAVQVVTDNGRVFISSDNLQGEPRLFTFPPSSPGAIHTVSTTPLGDNGPYRMTAVSTQGQKGARYLVYVGQPVAEANASVAQLEAALALVVPALVAALMGITWWLVGRSLRPVDVLRRQAADITGSDLSRRVDIPPSEGELARLAVTLNDLLSRLEGSLDQQRQFVADAAHELRSPVAAILAQLEVDHRYDKGGTSPSRETTILEVRRLSQLVDDLLALARLDAAPRLSATSIDLDDVVFAEVKALRSRTNLVVDVSGVTATRVQGESGLLTRAVRNLLDNAAHHAHRRISVRLASNAVEAVLTVADDGPGIAEQHRNKIFERFTRLADGRSRDLGGVGLGLSIVRDVVAAHHGQVNVEDNSPGARFTVRIPTAP
jgi:signal transduction histidine kinase